MNFTREKFYRWGRYFFYGLCYALASFVALEYLLPVILPFALAYVAAYGVRRIAEYLARRLGAPEWLWCTAIVTLLALGILAAVWFGVSALVREIKEALPALGDAFASEGGLMSRLEGIVRYVGEQFGDADKFVSGFYDALSNATETVSKRAAELATSTVGALPSALFSFFIGIIAFAYFVFGYKNAVSAIKKLVPRGMRTKVGKWGRAAMTGLARFLRVYLILAIINFTVLAAGFLVLRVDHSLLLALAVAVLDVLPVFGVGTVLIPWALWCFFSGQIFRGAGLAIIFAVVTVIREPIEAKLLGKSAGVHPVFALAAVYGGWRVCGILGMLLFPLALNAVSVAVGEQKNHKNKAKTAP